MCKHFTLIYTYRGGVRLKYAIMKLLSSIETDAIWFTLRAGYKFNFLDKSIYYIYTNECKYTTCFFIHLLIYFLLIY